jgi:hypothetical protein
MADNPDPTTDGGVAAGGDPANPLLADPEIEDGSSIAAAVWNTLEAEKDALGLPALKIQPLADFLKSAELPKLTKDEESAILNQALLQFQHLYPHLPFKTELPNYSDPVEQLTALASGLDTISEFEFHSAVAGAFGGVLDSHTCYGLPAPYRGAVAFLPFQVRFWQDPPPGLSAGVAEVMNAAVPNASQPGGLGHPFFGPGAEIVRWNYKDAVWILLGEELFFGPLVAGSEVVNITRKAILSTTVPLAYLPPPVDYGPQVVVHYTPRGGGPVRAIRFPWGVATNMKDHSGFPHAAYSLNVSRRHYVDRHTPARAAGASPAIARSEAALHHPRSLRIPIYGRHRSARRPGPARLAPMPNRTAGSVTCVSSSSPGRAPPRTNW